MRKGSVQVHPKLVELQPVGLSVRSAAEVVKVEERQLVGRMEQKK